MAASVFCCLRCCRDGGTGHIPLKEMPAVQLDTQHMGKGPPFPRPNGPPRVGRGGSGGSRGRLEKPRTRPGPPGSGRRPLPLALRCCGRPGSASRTSSGLRPTAPWLGSVFKQPGPLLSRGDTGVWTFPFPQESPRDRRLPRLVRRPRRGAQGRLGAPSIPPSSFRHIRTG